MSIVGGANGGEVSLSGGNSAGAFAGGSTSVSGGSVDGTGRGGDLNLVSGSSSMSSSGSVVVKSAGSTQSTGSVSVSSGESTSGSGGDVLMFPYLCARVALYPRPQGSLFKTRASSPFLKSPFPFLSENGTSCFVSSPLLAPLFPKPPNSMSIYYILNIILRVWAVLDSTRPVVRSALVT